MAATIKDIANRLGLSKSTVSYALNGHSRHVSQELRDRILEVARELDYRPNELARSLAIGRTHTIGFVPLGLDRYALCSRFTQLAIDAIYTAAEEAKLHILLPTGYNPEDPTKTPDPRFQARVDGLVLLTGENTSMIDDFRSRNIPLAIIAGSYPGALTFNADNAGGAAAAADHLVSLGHRRIGLIASHAHVDVTERGTAFLKQLKSHGIEVAPQHHKVGDSTVDGSLEAATELLKSSNRPTAVFAVNDAMALRLISVARELGISVPRDLSVLGFDDEWADSGTPFHLFMPALTTLRQPIREMSAAAFRAVASQIKKEEVSCQIFPTPFVDRGSTAPPTNLPSTH